MKSQVEVDELMLRIHQEAHRGKGPAPRRTQAGQSNGRPAEPAVPLPPPFQGSASGGALPGGLIVQAGQMLERARRKVAVGPGVPKLLRPFYRNQGGFNSILLESLECLREANRLLTVENDTLRTQVEKQNRWMEAAAHGIGSLETRLAGLERQNDHDQNWFANLQAHAEGQTARIDAADIRFDELRARTDGGLDELRARTDGGLNDLQSRLAGELDGLHSRIGETHVRLDTQHAYAREVHGYLDDLGKHTDDLQTQINDLGGRANEFGQRLGEVARQANETQAHVGRVNHQADEVQNHADRLAVHLHNLQTQADEQGAHTRRVHGYLDELGQHTNRIADDLAGLSARHDQLGQHTNRIADDLAGLSARHDELGQHANHIADDLASLSARHDELGQHANRIADDLAGLSACHDQLGQHANRIADDLAGLSTRHDELGKHANRIADDLSGLSARHDGLQAQADAQGAHTQRVHSQLDDAGRQINHWGGLIDRFSQQTDEVRDRIAGLGTHLNDLQAQANAQGEHGRRVHSHLDDLGKHLDAELKGDQPTSIASRQKRQEEAIRRLDDRLVTDGSYLKNQLWLHQRMLLASGQRRENPEASEDDAAAAPAGGPLGEPVSGSELDSLYVAFEDEFRGSRDDIKQRLGNYLPYVRDARAGSNERPLLDLGCGRGEWLEMLRENGFAAEGVDLNHCMIEQCRARHLQATYANVMDFLAAKGDASFGGLTAFHLIEHLPFPLLVRFFSECHRVLMPGGLAIFETPNPTNIQVGACFFYHDYTHQRPLPPPSTRFLVEHVGFAKVEVVPLNPWSEEGMVKGDGTNAGLVARFNEFFYGPQDYALVARTAGNIAG